MMARMLKKGWFCHGLGAHTSRQYLDVFFRSNCRFGVLIASLPLLPCKDFMISMSSKNCLGMVCNLQLDPHCANTRQKRLAMVQIAN